LIFLNYDPIFLQSPFTLEKVRQWQKDLHSDNQDVSFKAQQNLKKIGTTLALKDKKTGISKKAVACLKDIILKKIKDEKILKWRTPYMKRLKLKELFKGLDKETIRDIDISTTYNDYNELANIITAKIFQRHNYHITPQTVERYSKGKKVRESKLKLPEGEVTIKVYH
jgi:NCAIR mutase (PurE)-related protein